MSFQSRHFPLPIVRQFSSSSYKRSFSVIPISCCYLKHVYFTWCTTKMYSSYKHSKTGYRERLRAQRERLESLKASHDMNQRNTKSSKRCRISADGCSCGKSAVRRYSMRARSASKRAESSGRMSLWAATGGACGARVWSLEGDDGYFTNGLGGGAGGRR